MKQIVMLLLVGLVDGDGDGVGVGGTYGVAQAFAASSSELTLIHSSSFHFSWLVSSFHVSLNPCHRSFHLQAPVGNMQ